MENTQTETTEEAQENGGAQEAPRDAPGWYAFHGLPVLLQLREPYIRPNFSHSVVKDNDGNAAMTQVLNGVLFVERGPLPGTWMLILRVQHPETTDYGLIALDPGDVFTCTHMHRNVIQPP